ncbi:coth protein-domain-containing protein [Spinellus fusiger]|nr:coth protein-domain-containing protein [Spinellus fusiger]
MLIPISHLLVFLAVYVLEIYAANQTLYSVIGMTSSEDVNTAIDLGVLINGNVHIMEPYEKGSILFRGEAPSGQHYRYVKIMKKTQNIIDQEPFERDPIFDDSTFNEFYGRKWTYKDIETFAPLPNYPRTFNRLESRYHALNEIPSIHLTANATDVELLHTYYMEGITITANMTHISGKKITKVHDVKLKISGRSSRYLTKVPYTIKVPKKQSFEGYQKIKLRSPTADPSYMREKLSYDMLKSAGVPASQASYVRVFINNKAIGVFVLAEKYDARWIANEFNGGQLPYQHGTLITAKGTNLYTGNSADLSYHGDNVAYYNSSGYQFVESPVSTNNSMTELVTFIKFIDKQLKFRIPNTNLSEKELTETWEKVFDVDGFLINMVMEFYNAHVDGLLQNCNNYYLYKDPAKDRFVLISWDLDYVMGNGPVIMKKINIGDYRKYGGIKTRPLMKAILRIPTFRKRFETHVKNFADYFYEPTIANRVIDSHADFIQEDVEWDYSLPRIRNGLNFIPFGPHFFSNVRNNVYGDNAGKPLSISYRNSIDFLIRVNRIIDLNKSINGTIQYTSLYPIKQWFEEKYSNVYKAIG